MDWIRLAQGSDHWYVLMMRIPEAATGSVKGGEFLIQLSNYELLIMESVR